MTDAIRALRLAVEAGDLPLFRDRVDALGCDKDDRAIWVGTAFHGSLDAALALMKAVLPEWTATIRIHSRGEVTVRSNVAVWVEDDIEDFAVVPEFNACAVTPARALLLAVLKALEATASASQSPAHLGNQEGDSQ
jgi:hypothetical protein